jgi:TRAP-type C4-dicarboxylate transport system permease small subunit
MMGKFLDHLSSLERLGASVLIFFLTAFVVIDVGAREIFQTGIPWAQKGAVYMMIWAGFLGAILVTHKIEHLRPEVADKLWKGRGKIFYLRIQNLVVFLFTSLMAWYSFQYVAESREFGDRNVILDMPMWALQTIIPYTFISMSLRYSYLVLFPRDKDSQAVH